MKKITIFILTIMSITFTPSVVNAQTPPKQEQTAAAAQAKTMMNRLEEIKTMDASKMSRSEKKAIRKEVSSIKSKLHSVGGGVYISAGALILILVLLIIFL